MPTNDFELTVPDLYLIYVFVHTKKNFSSQSKAISSELKAKQKKLAIFTASRFTIIGVEYKPGLKERKELVVKCLLLKAYVS